MSLRTVHLTLALLICMHAVNGAESFRFIALGDMPYSPEQEAPFLGLLEQAAQEDIEFLMNVGDLKTGGTPCTEAEFEKIRSWYRDFPRPVVYSIGDNEWTDCRGTGVDALESLARLRDLFFKDESILRLQELDTEHQSERPEFRRYVENYRFVRSRVLFLVLHVCGSGNNRRVDDLASMEEYAARNAATISFLIDSFALAAKEDLAGVAVVIHANPDFERREKPGHGDFLAVLELVVKSYRKPVVCFHGDTHYYRIDKPLRDTQTNSTLLHFTRMEVFGSPRIAGVLVTVDPDDPEVFSYRPYYLRQ